MIDQQTAVGLVDRISGLDKFPSSRAAQKELVNAFQTAATPELAKSVTNSWIAESIVAPKPADIRRLLWEGSAAIRQRREACKDCDGSGARVAYFLVTFEGRSLRIARSERLGTDAVEARRMLDKLANNPGSVKQDVISAAEACACLRPVVLV